MLDLTHRAYQVIDKLFQIKERDEAAELLKSECAENLTFMENSTPEFMERIRFAAIKLSNGKLDKLYYAVDLAQKDWRDLLVFSDFADDIKAHEIWAEKILNYK